MEIIIEKTEFSIVYEGYSLIYYLVYTRNIDAFGVGIKSQKQGVIKTSECFNLTKDRKEALDFLYFLMKTATFPTTLNDMVEDWLLDN